jgi:hypothetical protein
MCAVHRHVVRRRLRRARGKTCGHDDRANQGYCSFHMISLPEATFARFRAPGCRFCGVSQTENRTSLSQQWVRARALASISTQRNRSFA